MPLQFNNDELLLIRENSLERVRTQLRENFLGILDGSPPDSSSFITLAPSRSECADFFGDILIELARTTCAKSITHDLRQPFRASIYMFIANWPKIITVNPSLVQPCVTLLECVVSNSSDDVAIWTAVYELLTVSARPVTPPAVTSAKSSAFDTPARPNSGSRLTESQTHELVDPYIRAEIQGNVYKDVLGFHIYFPGLDSSQWDCAVKCSSSCSETCQAQWDWSDETTATLDSWPAKPTETAAVQWFRKFNDRFIVHGPGLTRFYGSGARPLADSKCRRKCDIFLSQMLTNNNSTEVKPAANHQYSWYDVLVPGELKSNKDEDCTPDTVIELAGYAREVFGAQVGRRFVHAFTICGDVMRCYMFDRAGVSISQAFHINKNEKTFKLFVRIILCYATMGAAQFGFNTNYTTEHGEVFLPARQQPLPAFVAFKGQRFRLLEVLFYQPAIVSRGTLCWLARDEVTGEECVVKDAWRSKYRRSEGQFLDIAKRECAWGTVDCRLHGDVIVEGILDEITSNVRRGLDYISAKRVSISPKTLDRMLCLGNSETSHIGMQRMSRLNLQKSAANSSNTAKRQLPGYGPPNPKRLKLSSDGDENLEDDNEDMEGEDGDRVHTLLVFYTVGENISKFISVRHLLEVFRDAIKCHQSLVENGKILHRDISINNVLISKNPRKNDPKGFLIDLDLAKHVDSTHRSGAPHRTGTMEFMAIEILQGGTAHSWRHDLESFFYVLIWICALYHGAERPRKPRPTVLEGWSSQNAADSKYVQMASKKKFEHILESFAEYFSGLKDLMREWRAILFPLRNGEIFTGTHDDHKSVYEDVIGVFDGQIAKL